MKEEVILVDKEDQEIGVMEKLEAHEKGELHRAFSVFLFNAEGKMLLQRRALTKYHSGGLWTNACCSHPRPGEDTMKAAERRLQEEMGLSSQLKFITTFLYRSEFTNGLTEHELDHVFTGLATAEPQINPDEVDSYQWLDLSTLKEKIKTRPEDFTTWFRIAIKNLF